MIFENREKTQESGITKSCKVYIEIEIEKKVVRGEKKIGKQEYRTPFFLLNILFRDFLNQLAVDFVFFHRME